MALSRTLRQHKLNGRWGGGSVTSDALTAFTPADNSHIVVLFGCVDDGGGLGDQTAAGGCTIAGGGLAWTRHTFADVATNFRGRSVVWSAPVGTGVSTTITVTFKNGTSLGSWSMAAWEITGQDTASPTGGKIATASTVADGALSQTLDAAPASGDYVFALVHDDGDTNANSVTPGATFTEVGDLNTTTTAVASTSEIEERTGSTSTTADWVDVKTGAGTVFSCGAVAIVVKVAGGTTVAITGSSSTVSAGTVGVQIPVGPTAFQPDAFQNDAFQIYSLTLGLSGISSTLSPGTLTPSSTVPTTGIASTTSPGTVVANMSLPVTGVASTMSVGSLTPSSTVAVTGIASTGSPGTVIDSRTVPVTGIASTLSVGTMAPSTTIGLTGITGTGSPGNVSAGGDLNVALTGTTFTVSIGSVAPSSSVATTGTTTTISSGSVAAISVSGAPAFVNEPPPANPTFANESKSNTAFVNEPTAAKPTFTPETRTGPGFVNEPSPGGGHFDQEN